MLACTFVHVSYWMISISLQRSTHGQCNLIILSRSLTGTDFDDNELSTFFFYKTRKDIIPINVDANIYNQLVQTVTLEIVHRYVQILDECKKPFV